MHIMSLSSYHCERSKRNQKSINLRTKRLSTLSAVFEEIQKLLPMNHRYPKGLKGIHSWDLNVSQVENVLTQTQQQTFFKSGVASIIGNHNSSLYTSLILVANINTHPSTEFVPSRRNTFFDTGVSSFHVKFLLYLIA